jgi:hypothetical protein
MGVNSSQDWALAWVPEDASESLPDTVIVTSTANPTNGASPIAVVATDFASTDGGVTWQAIGSGEEYGELATYQGTTYALRADLVDESKRVRHLAASTNLLSWHDVDAAHASNVLACSADGGQSWTPLTALNVTMQVTMFQKSDDQLGGRSRRVSPSHRDYWRHSLA